MVDYSEGIVPENYKCSVCEATGCKLWREVQTSPERLLCAKCAAEDQKVDIDDIDANGRVPIRKCCTRTDRIGFCIPAVPVPAGAKHNSNYWGWGMVPLKAYSWWQKLPTTKGKVE
jgi:hypothetical protein